MAAESTIQTGGDAAKMHSGEFDLEFGEIQMALEGLSRDLDEKLISQSEEHGYEESRKGHKGSLNLEHLLTCDDEEFFKKIESLPVMDLDMAILVFEEHIKAHKKGVATKQGNAARSLGDFKGLRSARDRLNQCFLEKVRRSQRSGKPRVSPTSDDQHRAIPEKPKRYIVRASALPEEFECMTKTQLRALLRHHSVKHNSEADKNSLMELLIDEVLQGEGGDWEPPKEEEIKWAEPNEVFRSQAPYELPTGLDETDWHVTVAITDQKTMVDWDPVPLLKELYRPISQNQSDETLKNKPDSPPKLTGYLEKLPVNQTKPKAFKGWKRRFFKIMRGKIFYYEDNKAESPLGSLPLRGGKITVPGEKMIQITSEITGEILVVRCGSANESKDWYRVLHEEAVSSIKRRAMNGENDAEQSSIIVIDLGASSIRGGFASDCLPTVAFPAVYAVKHDRGSSNKFTPSGLPDPHLCSCGFDALRPHNRKVSKLVYPLKPSLKIDKYSVKVQYLPGFIENVIQSLYLKPSGLVVIISCPQYLGDQDKEYLCDYLFGQLNVKAVYLQQQAILALYSYSDTSGIIVDIGDHVDVIPVVEGTVVDHGRTSFPFGGQQITESLSKLLPQSGHRFFSEVESYIVRYVKEKCAFVYEEAISDKNVIIPKAVVDVKKFSLPNGEKEIEVDAAQVKCTEGLFEPSLWGKDHLGLHHAVAKAIKACGIDERREMCRKIYLTGGTTLLKGLPERLQKELKKLLPDGVTIQVQAGENRLNAAFKGAALLSKLPTFSEVLINQDEWAAYGAELLSRWHQK